MGMSVLIHCVQRLTSKLKRTWEWQQLRHTLLPKQATAVVIKREARLTMDHGPTADCRSVSAHRFRTCCPVNISVLSVILE